MDKCFVCKQDLGSYGKDGHGHKICKKCCGKLDRRLLERMKPGERTKLYFHGGEVTNWPGTFRAKAYGVKRSRHNFGLRRDDGWFSIVSADGRKHNFHFFVVGEDEICTVRKLKEATK